MSSGSREWRWVGEDGVQTAGTEEQLTAGLGAETIPFYTLVWRPGWLEWLPAMQVAELAGAMPAGRADAPVSPRMRETAQKPPPPPVYRYSVIKRRAATLSGRGPAAAAPSSRGLEGDPASLPRPEVRPAPAPESPALATSAERVAKLEPPSVEDVELEAIEKSSPRTSFSVDDIELDKDEFGPPPEPPPQGASASAAVYVPPRPPPTSERPLPSFDEVVPPFPAAPSPPADLHDYANRAAKAEKRSQRRSFTRPAIGAAAVMAILGTGLWLRRGPRQTGTVPSASITSRAAKPPLSTCRIAGEAKRIANSADPSVQPLFAAVGAGPRLAIGYAESDSAAVGMTIDPSTFERDFAFHEKKSRKLASVAPLSASGKIRFEVSRAGDPSTVGRKVEASPPFSIASGPSGIVRIDGEGQAEVVYPVSGELTIPRVASTGAGHAVTARSGGKAGKIVVGFLDPSGKRRGELFPVPGSGDFVGMPSIAASDEAALVAFAARSANDPGWALAVSRVKWGLAPAPAVRIPIPSGGPGGEAISPSVSALSGGRWLLAWTEGQSGNRAVRAEVLGLDLTPAGTAVTISPSGANAGQPVLWAVPSGALTLFYVLAGESQEMWAATLSCDPEGKKSP